MGFVSRGAARRGARAIMGRMDSLARAIRHLELGQWEEAHVLVQEDESPLACWVHGIVHLQEGDLDNARYWYRRARRPLPSGADPGAELAALREATR